MCLKARSVRLAGNMPGRRDASVRRCAPLPAVTAGKERVPGEMGDMLWFFCAAGAAVAAALCAAILLEQWLGLAPTPPPNAPAARHAGRHHRCRNMPPARHPGLCPSLKAPGRPRTHTWSHASATAPWPDIPSGPAWTFRTYIPAATHDPAAAPSARPPRHHAVQGSCRHSDPAAPLRASGCGFRLRRRIFCPRPAPVMKRTRS